MAENHIHYEDGVYRITPLSLHTAFDCIVHRKDDGYVLIDLRTNHDLEVTQELLDHMRPIFMRKE